MLHREGEIPSVHGIADNKVYDVFIMIAVVVGVKERADFSALKRLLGNHVDNPCDRVRTIDGRRPVFENINTLDRDLWNKVVQVAIEHPFTVQQGERRAPTQTTEVRPRSVSFWVGYRVVRRKRVRAVVESLVINDLAKGRRGFSFNFCCLQDLQR